MAKHVGTSRQNIENLEAKPDMVPRYVAKLATALGVTVNDLITNRSSASNTLVESVQNQPTAPVALAQAATNSVAISAECQMVCDMFLSLPNDPFIRADIMGKISAMIQQAKDPTTHQERPGQKTGTH